MALGKDLNRLFDATMRARIHYGIWYVLKNRTDRRKYVDVMNDYYWFFSPSIGAHFTAMLLELCSIYDQKENRVNIHRVINHIGQMSGFDRRSFQGVRRRMRSVQPLLRKALILRHNVFAHMSAKLDPEDAFRKAQISMFNFRSLINHTEAMLQQLAKLSGNRERTLVESSELDVRDVLETLRRAGGKEGLTGSARLLPGQTG